MIEFKSDETGRLEAYEDGKFVGYVIQYGDEFDPESPFQRELKESEKQSDP